MLPLLKYPNIIYPNYWFSRCPVRILGSKKINNALCRSVLCMMLLVAAGGTFLLENPLNSLVALHPRFIWLSERLQRFGIHVP